MKNTTKILAGIGLAFATANTANASNIGVTFGEDYGHACYTEAVWGNAGASALDTCNKALSEEVLTTRNRAATFVNRGIVRARRGDIDGAIEDYEQALAIKSNLGDAFANIGTAYIRANRHADALPMLQKALEFEHLAKRSHVYFNLALAQEKMGDTKAAYLSFKKASAENPNWDWPRQELERFTVVSR